MKYLGLTPDSQLKLRPHFKLLAPKVTTSPNALRALLPNIGGAKIGVHRLHEGVASSRFVYGAPVWAQDLMKSRRYMKRPCYTIYDIEYLSGKAHERAAVIRRNDIRHHLHSKISQEHVQTTTVTIQTNSNYFQISAVYALPRHKMTLQKWEQYFQYLGDKYIAAGEFTAKHTLWD